MHGQKNIKLKDTNISIPTWLYHEPVHCSWVFSVLFNDDGNCCDYILLV